MSRSLRALHAGILIAVAWGQTPVRGQTPTDPDAVMLPPNQNAVVGRDAIRKQMEAGPPGSTLVWKPYKAEVSRSGDLGYTLGTYEARGPGKDGKPVTTYGKYCSVWKRQADGSWKWVVDVGTPSPPPG